MQKKGKTDKEIWDIVSKVEELLDPLTPEERKRVLFELDYCLACWDKECVGLCGSFDDEEN